MRQLWTFLRHTNTSSSSSKWSVLYVKLLPDKWENFCLCGKLYNAEIPPPLLQLSPKCHVSVSYCKLRRYKYCGCCWLGWDAKVNWDRQTDKTQGESDAGGGGGSKAAALQSCLVVWNTFPKECKNLPTLLLRVRKWSNYQWIKVIIPISRHFAKWVGGWMANGKPFRI